MRTKKRIYMDNAASTKLDPRVEEAMEPYWGDVYGNPGAIHTEGVKAKKALEEARAATAAFLGAHNDEIIFTSGGTESNALAIFGLIKRYEREHNNSISELHLITSAIEHSSVLDGFRELEDMGAKVDYIDVAKNGIFNLEQLKKALTPKTFLVSLMYANNEIGTIEPIERIGKIITKARVERNKTPFFHTDASQAMLWLNLDVGKINVDLVSMDAQKINGPKGSGALYVRRGTPIGNPLFRGGKQEMGIRPGTEPVPLIVGMAKACELAESERENTSMRVLELRDYFIKSILGKVHGAELNGSMENRLPNNVNISVPGFESEYLILALDAKGIACSARSACLSDDSGSYVVSALGKNAPSAKSALRFSLGKDSTKNDVDYVVEKLAEIVETGRD